MVFWAFAFLALLTAIGVATRHARRVEDPLDWDPNDNLFD